MEALLDRMAVGRLGLSTEDGPYVVPVNYVFAEGCIYFHSGHEGKKVEALRANPRVCFLVDEPGPQVTWEQGCGISQIYESVMCFGKAEFVEEIAERRRILEMLIGKYVPGDNHVPILDRNVENTAVVRIHIEWMTGKANPISSSHHKISNRFLPA
jgi:nitroimidazol reductase NimA-like FMN-containing flavoprotein (pyridoxamine 5'-phosphate oxidase superfamily)